MCWNCEGNIALEEEICPYCRASIMPTLEGQSTEEMGEQKTSSDDTAFLASTMALLMGGSFFFIFGCLLLFFSNNGYFVLRWSSHYWYLYFLVAIPMVLWGARNLMSINDDTQEVSSEDPLPQESLPSLPQEPIYKNHKKKNRRN